ncbi:MAG TPA: family 43 glycosylhydrolase [Arachnia sp.]|nr:family 43 glycosylhydrolase [Arachnia sp.]HMT86796.1 family 43 glycosylhydrolase [Arachnia sp.]
MKLINPVVRGFAPDPSMIRVGDWYYLATSSFEWFPTIPLFRSRNLVDWEHAGSVDTAIPGGSLLGYGDSAGIWAPALSYADGLFWLVYGVVGSVGTRFFDLTVYVCTAAEIAGPWSEPVRVPGYGFDPSLFHHEGRHFLLNLRNDSRIGGRRFDGIVLQELEVPLADGAPAIAQARPVGDVHLLLQSDELVEGPKITAKDGWFYLLLAEGGTGYEHGVLVARSRELTGPYETDAMPLLTTRDDPWVPLQKAGHGELVQAPTGEWFLAHLASRPVGMLEELRNPLGRETAIQPIVWIDDWPRLAHGGWHPETVIEVPDLPRTPSAGDPVGLESAPAWPWSTLRAPAGDWLDNATRPGWTRLRGRMSPESRWEQSLLAQRLTEHRARVEVTVDAEPMRPTESAGLVLWYNTTSWLTLHLTWLEDDRPGPGDTLPGRGRRVLTVEQGHPDGARRLACIETGSGPLRLRADIAQSRASFSVALDGGDFRQIGHELDFSELSDDFGPALRFTGAMAGISAIDTLTGTFTADFTDWSLTTTPLPVWDA